jgi:hypothetical protein
LSRSTSAAREEGDLDGVGVVGDVEEYVDAGGAGAVGVAVRHRLADCRLKSEVIPAAIPATTIHVPRGGQPTTASALLSQTVTAKGER